MNLTVIAVLALGWNVYIPFRWRHVYLLQDCPSPDTLLQRCQISLVNDLIITTAGSLSLVSSMHGRMRAPHPQQEHLNALPWHWLLLFSIVQQRVRWTARVRVALTRLAVFQWLTLKPRTHPHLQSLPHTSTHWDNTLPQPYTLTLPHPGTLLTKQSQIRKLRRLTTKQPDEIQYKIFCTALGPTVKIVRFQRNLPDR